MCKKLVSNAEEDLQLFVSLQVAGVVVSSKAEHRSGGGCVLQERREGRVQKASMLRGRGFGGLVDFAPRSAEDAQVACGGAAYIQEVRACTVVEMSDTLCAIVKLKEDSESVLEFSVAIGEVRQAVAITIGYEPIGCWGRGRPGRGRGRSTAASTSRYPLYRPLSRPLSILI